MSVCLRGSMLFHQRGPSQTAPPRIPWPWVPARSLPAVVTHLAGLTPSLPRGRLATAALCVSSLAIDAMRPNSIPLGHAIAVAWHTQRAVACIIEGRQRKAIAAARVICEIRGVQAVAVEKSLLRARPPPANQRARASGSRQQAAGTNSSCLPRPQRLAGFSPSRPPAYRPLPCDAPHNSTP